LKSFINEVGLFNKCVGVLKEISSGIKGLLVESHGNT
jgi:hypothetical protein